MPSPRAKNYHEAIGLIADTFKIDNSTIVYDQSKGGGSAGVGLAVSLSADDTVQLATTGDRILGKLMRVQDDNFCSVQISGVCTLPGGNGASLTYGRPFVGALGAASARGYIKEIADSATPTAAEVNAILKAHGTILDASDATAVAVVL